MGIEPMTNIITTLDTVIRIGAKTMTVRTNINCPVVINSYTINGKTKRYNKNWLKMKYSSLDGANWMLSTMNRLSKGDNKVWYIAGIEERYTYPIVAD